MSSNAILHKILAMEMKIKSETDLKVAFIYLETLMRKLGYQ
jgi:hypothetical protein